ncbi:hypothetical protein P3T76_004142 [Phytophthora citrophthora]|uniref:Uncharacterized protein n=1 Tax=Phytophthora citrophthora TaxID=4793 RepID=A0AAD9GSX0_9STRA|nr:hypothetical protein P3T76_004142 [Phytophthora citrophthora]
MKRNRLEAQWKRVTDMWFGMQLSHYGGKYSIERMLALEEYTRQTTFTRLVLVSVGVPLLIVVLVVCQESVPLQDPADGWEVNYGFWVRVGCLGAVIGFAGGSQLGSWLDVSDLSGRQLISFCSLKAIGFVAAGIAVAEIWVFPIPFFILSLSLVWPVILVVSLRIVVGAHAFHEIRSRQEQLQRLNKLGTLQGFLCAAYPAYQVVFNHANHTSYELPVLLFLPLCRIVMKIIFSSAASHKEDMIPEEVVFTVDFFDAFYLATFMPQMSTTTLITLLTIHFIQTALELQELHRRTQSILMRLREAAGLVGTDMNNDLLTALRSLCYYSTHTARNSDIRVNSSIFHKLSPEGKKLLDTLNFQGKAQLIALKSSPNSIHVRPQSVNGGSRTSSTVQPLEAALTLPRRPSLNGVHRLTRTRTKQRHSLNNVSMILQEALEVLFASECLVLIEYVEIIIPAFYAVYVLAMVHVPSAQYHSEMSGITRENAGSMVSRMLIFALMELISIVVLALIMKRNCGIHALYQLGFVLETQMAFVMSKLLLWIVFTLAYRVKHFGTYFVAYHPKLVNAWYALQAIHCGGKSSLERALALVGDISCFNQSLSSNHTGSRLRGRLEVQFKKAMNLWFSMQLSHYGGKYSIERMLALEEYTRQTTFTRLVLVSVGVPLLIVVLVVCQESVPLQDPADGWEVNYGFWVRVGCLGAIVAYTAGRQHGSWLDVSELSGRQLIVFSSLTVVGFVAAGMTTAKIWVFPIPFFILSLSPVLPVILVVSLRIAVGTRHLQQIRSRQELLQKLSKLGTLQYLITAVYPAYEVLFNHANHTSCELPVLLFLPLCRIVMKIILSSAASHKEDRIPEYVVFTVDFFDAFYLATFMPQMSTTTLITLLTIHFIQTALELQELHRRTQSILIRLHEAVGLLNTDTSNDLLTALRSLCYYSIQTIQKSNIRVNSSISHQLSLEGKKLLDALNFHGKPSRITLQPSANFIYVLSKSVSWTSRTVKPLASVAILPKHPSLNDSKLTRTRTKQRDSTKNASKILQEALEVLFTSECLILVEFVEIVIPALYAGYILTMVHLPSAQYHSEMAGITRENAGSTVSRMLIFALMEFISFFVLTLIMRRNCGIRALYQLGFVLETQMSFVISQLLLWIVFTLTYRVKHFGTFIIVYRSKPTITHCGGKYSLERALALDEFTRKTSAIRVLLLITTPPLITLTVVLCQEVIPLQDPMAGWRANYGFWPRVATIGATLGSVLSSLMGPWLDVPPLSRRQNVMYWAGVGATLVAAGILTAELWVFPVPFFIISLLVPLSWILLLFLCAVVGIRAFRRILSRRDQLRRMNNVSWLLMLMCVGYPALQVLFIHANHTIYELPVLLLLPVFKILMKRLFAHIASHKWDIVPEEIVFAVDFFDALYQTTFIPNLTFVALTAIVVIDIVQTGADLLELHHRTHNILERLRQAVNLHDDVNNPSLLSAVRFLVLQNDNISGIRVRSCISYQLSDVDQALLEKLERCWKPDQSIQHSPSRIHPSSQDLALVTVPGRVRNTITVMPYPPVNKQPKISDIVTGGSRKLRSSIIDSSGVLQEALEVLFTSEILILTEYLEIIVPLIYGIFVLAMVHLPSAQYHTEMAGVTRENVHSTVSRMFIYALLELLSFLLLVGIIKRNCCIDALYQLAFVLETHSQLVLSKLLVWMMFTLALRVVHFGMIMVLVLLSIRTIHFLIFVITHCGGKYSLERALALDEFTRKTSTTRVLLLITTPPLITLTVVLCQEVIPLQDPMAGWRVNYGFWSRVGITGVMLGSLLSSLMGPWLDVPPLSRRQNVMYCAGVGAAMIIAGILTAEVWVFPVPFFIVSIFVPTSWVFVVLLCAVVGIRAFRRILSRRDQLRRMNNVSWLLMLMCVGYPALQVLFIHANHTIYELPVLLLLPVLKILMKRLFAHIASHKWDIVPEEIVFAVDFFDALYQTTFIPNLTFVALTAIVVIDIVQTGADLLELHHRTHNILERLRQAVNLHDDVNNPSLLSAVRFLVLQNDNISGIRVRSCISYQLSDVDQALLEKLERCWKPDQSIQHSPSRIHPSSQDLALVTVPGRVRNTITVMPYPPVNKQPKISDIVTGGSHKLRLSIADSSGVLQEALEVLFTSEILILTEYLEIIVPLIYGIFVLAMVHLPSAQYHTEMAGVTLENVHSTVSRMFIYALLELLSFLLLVGIIKRNCCIDALYQLAFVLETHSQLVLSKLLVWMMFTLALRVVHFGMIMILVLLSIRTIHFLIFVITHCGGKYSLERALALDEFTRKTSTTRVLLLITTPPLITLTVVLCQEVIPLQDPMAGWRVNYGFWSRVGITGVMLGSLLSSLMGPWLDVPPLSRRQNVMYCAGVGAAMIIAGILTAEVWVFPVPFFIVSIFVPTSWVFVVLLCAVVGIRAFRRILSRRDQLRRMNNVSWLLMLMCVGYPALQVLFIHANHTIYELPVLLLLPVLKILMKRLFAHIASHKWDIVPEEIVFTVDFFDALYLATFIPNLTFVALTAIVVIDIVQTGADLLELHHRTHNILERLRQAVNLHDDVNNPSLLSAVRFLVLQNDNISGIRVRSCISYQLSDVDQALLEKLERCWKPDQSIQHSPSRIHPSSQDLALVTVPGRVRNTITVMPYPPVNKQPKISDIVTGGSRKLRSSIIDSSGVLQEALEVLFTSEILILTEYLEIIVPLIYGIFVLAMVHLPSAQYHTEMAGVTLENVHSTVSRMFIYALLELLSFLLLVGIIKRNCCIDALYQLAFVLETHSQLVLSKLLVWMMFTLALRVVHFGMIMVLVLLSIRTIHFLIFVITHCGGKYSLERALALDEFTRKTSTTRVLLLITTPPLITLTVVLCQEVIPLQDPMAGWRVNYGFWSRVGITGVMLGSLLSSLMGPWLDVPPLSRRQNVMYCAGVGAAMIIAGILTAEVWVFPVPFFIVSIFVPTSWVFVVLLCAVVGIRAFRRILSRRDQLRRMNNVSWLLMLMCVGYPALQVLFIHANHTIYELPVLLLLPVLKILMKRLFAHIASHKWDIVPEEIVFAVDFFDALYQTTFIPNLTFVALTAIVVIDIVQTGADLLELHHRTHNILERLRQAVNLHDDVNNPSLLSAVRFLVLQNDNISGIRVRSCISYQLSDVDQALLEKLERCWKPDQSIQHSPSRIHPSSQDLALVTVPGRVRNTITVMPYPPVNKQPKISDIVTGGSRKLRSSIVDSSGVLQEALEVLFTSEILILTEYLEIIVPLIYGIFVLAMVHLPSAQYHTEMAGVTRENVHSTVSRMFIYALLELLSFLLLVGIIKRNCCIDALYQLAFVLETQSQQILSKLVHLMTLTLTYRVLHFGTTSCKLSLNFGTLTFFV